MSNHNPLASVLEAAIARLKHNARTLDDMYLEGACDVVENALDALVLENGTLRGERKLLVEIAEQCLELSGRGDYTNGNTDPTGTIDEGEVRASQMYYRLKGELEAITKKEQL